MNKQQQVRDYLESTIKEKGLSLNSLSLKLGKNSTYLFHFIKRHSPKRLDETTRRKLAAILNVPEQELCDFPLPSNIIQDKLSTITTLFNFNRSKNVDIIAIDVIDIDNAPKGRFDQILQNTIGQHLMGKNILNLYTSSAPENIKIIKISGEAMSPTINHGDIIWLDISHSVPSTDGLYLISTPSDTMIRRIQTNPFDNSIDILADNKLYKSFTIKNLKNLNICGKVIHITHRVG